MPATILIVEDHDAIRVALRDWLKIKFPRCRVIQAASGEEAMALIRVEPPQLIVMDIGLPGMSGIEATRQIKADLPSTQIVMLTVHEGNAYRAHAALCGASAYVAKGAMQSELEPTLAALLGNARG